MTKPNVNISTSIAPPNLPNAPPEYSPTWQNQFGGILRQFFTQIVNLVNTTASKAVGVYSTVFKTGYVQYSGPNNQIAGDVNFEYGTNLPNPSGVSGPCLLLGSGGGHGTPAAFWIISDQAFDTTTPGNTLGITAGEAAPGGTAAGGQLFLVGGGSAGGTGGPMLVQGGTSKSGPGGSTTIAGGNSTNGTAGDLFLIGGQNGIAGANVHIIMTKLNGIAGNVRIRVNSTVLYQIDQFGALSIGALGPGIAGQTLHSGGPGASCYWG